MTERPTTLEEYLAYLDRLPVKYAVVTEGRVPLRRRIWRWLMAQIGY